MIGNPEDRLSNDAAKLIRIELCTTFLFGVESFVILCYSNGFITIFDEEKNHGKISGLVTKNVIMVSDQVRRKSKLHKYKQSRLRLEISSLNILYMQ